MTHYVAQLTPDPDGGFVVTFPDVPEAITQGDTHTEAVANAVAALESALLIYAEDRKAQPEPTVTEGVRVAVGAQVAAKLALIDAFLASGQSQSGFARSIGKGETEVRRMLNPWHATKLTSIEQALAALGKRLVISVEEVA